ncbi:MAG: SLBB domain-containing protein [Nitrospirae bacterium]|nr:SLBB domain-containing protein [Nitrospirota bacterium]
MMRYKSYLAGCLFFIFYIASLVIAEGAVTDEYRVDVNDVLDIKVLDHEDLHTMTTIALDGSISVPYIGTLNVKNMTLSQIEEEITKKLGEGYINYPVVTVSLVKSMSIKIYAYGEILGRGELPYDKDMTVMKALSTARGVTSDGLFGKLKIKRKQKGEGGRYKEIRDSGIRNGIIEDKEVENIVLQPDDILIVERNNTFLIQGESVNRGRAVLENGLTAGRALLQAGGVSKDGQYGKLIIRRKKGEDVGQYSDIAESNINDGIIVKREVEDTVLEPDDILIVERSKTYLVQGEVFNRGRFVLEKDTTIIRALLQGGGISVNGQNGKVILRRKGEGNIGQYYVVAESILSNGVIESRDVEDVLIQPDDILIVEVNRSFYIQGEIAKSGKYVLEKDMTVSRAISIAGGVSNNGLYGKVKIRRRTDTSPGYTDMELDMKEVTEGKETGEMLIQPDDIITVELNKSYYIYGEVNRPGEFVLKDDMTVFKAITIAGGFTKWGSEGRVKILRSNGKETGFDTIKVNLNDIIADETNDVKLEPDDIIVAYKGIF